MLLISIIALVTIFIILGYVTWRKSSLVCSKCKSENMQLLGEWDNLEEYVCRDCGDYSFREYFRKDKK